jgi:transcriptional regulator with XRE-family HTH domain
MVRKYEVGEHDPTGHALKLLAGQLKVSVDYLLGLSDDPESQIHESNLKTDERRIVETFRREGWPGIMRLGVERLSK